MIRATLLLASALLLTTLPAYAQPQLKMCGNQRNTPTKACLVDGDTLCLQGEKSGSRTSTRPSRKAAFAAVSTKNIWRIRQAPAC